MNKEELEKRTLEFGKNLIRVINKLPNNQVNYKISGQVIDSGTSIGANYREANASESPKDFKHKINLSFKEAKETKYWLDILITNNPDSAGELGVLHKESDELMRIFGKAVTTCRENAEMRYTK